jgi:hypothetical protein
VSTTSGTIVAIGGAGIGFGLKKLFGEGSAADAQVIVVAALGYVISAMVAAAMDRDLLGPDLADEPPRTRGSGAPRGPRARRRAHGTSGRTGRRATPWRAIGAHRFFYGVSTISAILLFRSYFHDPDDVDAGLAGLASAFARVRPRLLRRGRGHDLRSRIAVRKHDVDHDLLRVAAAAASASTSSPSSSGCCTSARSCSASPRRARRSASTRSCRSSVDDAYRRSASSPSTTCIFNVAFVSAAPSAAAGSARRRQLARGLSPSRGRLRRHRLVSPAIPPPTPGTRPSADDSVDCLA